MYKSMNDELKKIRCETSDEQIKSRLSILTSSDDSLASACLVKYIRNREKLPDENVIEFNKANGKRPSNN